MANRPNRCSPVLTDCGTTMEAMAVEMKQLQGAQLRLENQQQVIQTKMHQMEKALAVKLDALLTALQSPDAPGVPSGGDRACPVPKHGAHLAPVPEPEAACAPEQEFVTEGEDVPVCINSDLEEGVAAPSEDKRLRVRLADIPDAKLVASTLGNRPSR
eukprot:COSAG02_NODE_443_length_22233_cov_69.528870_8_plen_158_part_00